MPSDQFFLAGQDGTRYMISRRAALLSGLISHALEAEPDTEELPLPAISAALAVKFLEYLEYHADVPPRALPRPVATDSLQHIVDEYDWAFLSESSQEMLFELLLVRPGLVPLFHCSARPVLVCLLTATLSPRISLLLPSRAQVANYFAVPSLSALVLAHIASMMYLKPAHEIQSLFNIRTDATPEEAQAIAKRFKTAVFLPPLPPSYPHTGALQAQQQPPVPQQSQQSQQPQAGPEGPAPHH
jgi:hypothetical protein